MEPSSKKKKLMVVGSNRGVEVRDQLVAFTNNKTREAPQFGDELYLASKSNASWFGHTIEPHGLISMQNRSQQKLTIEMEIDSNL